MICIKTHNVEMLFRLYYHNKKLLKIRVRALSSPAFDLFDIMEFDQMDCFNDIKEAKSLENRVGMVVVVVARGRVVR